MNSFCIYGCTDIAACNFDPEAGLDDGSCVYNCNGCTDIAACNYSSTATEDDGSCLFAPINDTYETSLTVNFGDSYIGDLCCTGVAAENPCLPGTPSFDVWYHANSSSCEDIQFNVTNIDGATLGMVIWVDSCQGCNDIYPIACCPEVTGTCAGSMVAITSFLPNWDYYFSVFTTNPDECGTFSFSLVCTSDGCMDPLACNFDPNALDDDGSCEYFDACGICGGTGVPGCNNPNACNYDPAATCSDGSCVFPELFYLDCDGNCLNDSNNDGICDGEPVFGCNTEFACNYNPIVTDDDGSCFFATAVYDCDGNCQQDTDGDGICDQNEGQNGAEFCGDDTVWDPISQTCIGVDDCPADLNNDEIIDTTDLLLFLISFGTACE